MEAVPSVSPFNSSLDEDTFKFIVDAITSKQTAHQEIVSPVLLHPDWSRLSRIIFLTLFSMIGSCGNIFLISSICVEDQLKKTANSLLVNTAILDLVVSGCILPVSIVSLLAMNSEDDYPPLSVCKFQSFLISLVTLVSVLTLALTSLENYMRLYKPGSLWFTKRSNVTTSVLFTWVFGLSASVWWYSNDFFNYCERRKEIVRHSRYEIGFLLIFYIGPLLMALFLHVQIIINAKKLMKKPNFKPNMAYQSDFSLIRSNFFSFLTFVIFWFPFGVVMLISILTPSQNVSDKMYYYSVWFGLSKCCFHNFLYCFTNKNFANAYYNLFNYCCCKTTVSTTRRRQNDVSTPRSDVRVHIIPGYGNLNMYTSPQRSHCDQI